MEIDELPENDERLLKTEIKRDEMGRFEQHGAGLIKKPDIIKNPRVMAGLGLALVVHEDQRTRYRCPSNK